MIKSIRIKKFRQLENVYEEKIGLINELYGSNGSGKTSFISFISWIIYGETLDYGKNDDMNIDTFKPFELISGEIECDNDFVFTREFGYDESGKKTNDFYVNGRKTKNQIEYYNAINNCFNVNNINFKIKDCNILRALSDPYYLPNNETQFRTLISELLNIDTYSILFENDEYVDIKKDFDNQSKDYQMTKDFYKQKIKQIDNDLEEVIKRINEIKLIKFNKEEYDNLAKQINDETENFSYNEDNQLKENIDKLNDIYYKLIESRKKDLIEKPLSPEEKELKENKEKYNTLVNEYNTHKKSNEYNENLRNLIKQKIDVLNNELEEIKKQKFKEIKCPKCDTLINEDDYKKFNKEKVEKTKKLKEKIEIANKEYNSYIDFDITNEEKELSLLKENISRLKEVSNNNPIIYSSEQTNVLENEYNKQNTLVQELRSKEKERKEKAYTEHNNKIKELQEKYNSLHEDYIKSRDLEIYKKNKETLLHNKSVYELRLQKLEQYKIDEINLIKSKTSDIFGKDFEFEMVVKNKINDNYKKVCYASIDGLEHNKSNTAKFLKYSIMLLEKLKSYIGGCDIPIIFDIADNIGKKARKEIFDIIKSSQIFYTRISDDDNVDRKLNLIEKEIK